MSMFQGVFEDPSFSRRVYLISFCIVVRQLWPVSVVSLLIDSIVLSLLFIHIDDNEEGAFQVSRALLHDVMSYAVVEITSC